MPPLPVSQPPGEAFCVLKQAAKYIFDKSTLLIIHKKIN